MSVLNPINVPLEGIHTIEASAGTGKTYNLTMLYLRAVVEKRLPVSRILVVTFTEAAAAELRDRIRRRLSEACAAFEGEGCTDPLVSAWAEGVATDEDTRRVVLTQLRSALFGMDEAAIHTIHGFCNRVLRENAFETQVPFDAELVTDSDAFRDELANDFWRHLLHRYSEDVVRMLLVHGPTRDSFRTSSLSALDARMARVLGPDDGCREDFDGAMTSLNAATQDLRRLLASDGTKALKLIQGAIRTGMLRKNVYKEEKLAGQWEDLCAWVTRGVGGEKPDAILLPFTREKLAGSRKKDAPLVEHPLFDACQTALDASAKSREAFSGVQGIVWQDYLDFLVEEQPRRKAMRNIQFFDDLMLHVFDAATGPAGDVFTLAIRSRFPVALIDEFQDTDPIQWEIFKSVYEAPEPDHALFLIGDPKQAIYRFRRADVYAYLRARESADERYTIDRNFRSVPELISAVNVMFSREDPFQEPLISYREVSSGRADTEHRRLTVDGAASAPMHILQLSPDASMDAVKPLTKRHANAEIGRCVAAEIAVLVNKGVSGDAQLGGDPVMPRDIAILVNKHKQGRLMQDALTAVGVDSVIAGQSSVFDSVEAAAFRVFLRAMVHCEHEAYVRAALLSDFVGFTTSDVDALGREDRDWEDVVAVFRSARDTWAQRGLAAAAEHLFRHWATRAELLQYDFGDRRLTNLMHLVELVHCATTEHRLGLEDTLHWLAQKIQQSGNAQSEEDLLRLESDADRVRIVTVHKSKGLEYPIVFCPFAWDVNTRRYSSARAPLTYHDHETHQAVVDLGSADYDSNRTHAEEEEQGEWVRLLYVALTRAESRCYIVSGFINSYAKSALAYLLHGESPTGPAITRDLAVLAETYPDAFVLRQTFEIADCAVSSDRRGRASLHARALPEGRRLPQGWRISSFSSLASDSVAEVRAVPDRDETVMPAPEPLVPEGIHAFPAGAVPGTAFHAIFESLPFAPKPAELKQAVATAMMTYGFDAKWEPIVCKMVRHVLAERLPDGFSLSDLKDSDCLKELEFYFPLNATSVVQLAETLARYGYGESLEAEDALRRLSQTLSGFMKGFVDLVCYWQGRYWILDYKSNRLGTHQADYGPERLSAEMSAHHYRLQYLIYLCALHRFLGVRLGDGYDYDSHIGGAYYLFVRGIGPGCATQHGVFHDRPPKACIEALLACFDGAAAEEGS